jgi:multiple sugar transport system permease protein
MTLLRGRLASLARHGALLFWVLVVAFPLYWILITSFKPPVAVSTGPTYLPGVDFRPTLAAWEWMFFSEARSEVARAFANSLIAASGSAFLATFLGALGAYGLARFRYRLGPWRNDDIAFWFISQRMLPPVAVVLAFLLMFRETGLLDTQLGLVIAYTGFALPFAIWILRNSFVRIPIEIEESARVEGCGRFATFWYVALPLARPGLVASALFCFIFAWNEYLFALMLTFQEATTVQPLLAARITSFGAQWDRLSALTLVNLMPALVIGVLLERYLSRGLFGGGVR